MIQKTEISLDRIRLYAYHGVMEQERKVGAWFTLSLSVEYPFARALETDDVADTINYADMLNIAKAEMQIPSQLIEHVAGRIANRLIAEYPAIDTVTIRLTKDNPPMAANIDGASVVLKIKNDNKTNKS